MSWVALNCSLACSVCGGDSGADQVRAARLGVIALICVVVPLLVAIAWTARTWARRARALEHQDQA